MKHPAGLGIILLVMTFLSPLVLAQEVPCQPTLKTMPKFEERVSRLYEIWFDWILIGCRSELEKIGPSEVSEIESAARRLLKDYEFTFELALKVDEERAELVRKLRSSSGVDGFSDVFVYNFGFKEWLAYCPSAPGDRNVGSQGDMYKSSVRRSRAPAWRESDGGTSHF